MRAWRRYAASGWLAVNRAWADRLFALRLNVQHQGVVDDVVAVLVGDHLLTLLDFLIDELDHLTGLGADHMIMVAFIGQLEYGGASSKLWRNTMPACSN